MDEFTKRRFEKIAVEYNDILEERGVIAASMYLADAGETSDDVWRFIRAEHSRRARWSY